MEGRVVASFKVIYGIFLEMQRKTTKFGVPAEVRTRKPY
jgi:hypothetical protein